jgi:chorismate mutase
LSDIDAERIDHFISVGMHDYTPTADALDKEVLQVVNECLELMKGHIAQQRWKSELAKKEASMPMTDPSEENGLNKNL